MKQHNYRSLSNSERSALLKRPGGDFSDILPIVTRVLEEVRRRGDDAVQRYTREFDSVELSSYQVLPDELATGEYLVNEKTKQALRDAASSIRQYHIPQVPQSYHVQTRPGVSCTLDWRPINRVGLYVPGGSAPLVSTLLMLVIPAVIAGCKEIVVMTPPRSDGTVSPEILFATSMLGVSSIFKIGGSQAIGAMAFGTETVPKVDKIFGPGNRYVAAAKAFVAQPPFNVPSDMVAGPTELLIIADESSNPRWVASDLLSQAEHGRDSQVVLVTPSVSFANNVEQCLQEQLSSLPRSGIAKLALKNSPVILVESIDEALEFSNLYAPEHLIIATNSASQFEGRITNAGSVFLGPLTSVVFGDYASGTNHTLPTGGTASATGGVTVGSFMKPIFFQTVTADGLNSLVETTAILAEAEGLTGHANAARMRGMKS
jgi:histidinol dehydrogenase